MKQSSSPSRQDTLQTGQPDSQIGTFHDASVESTDPADCPRCGSSNSRKRRIRCSTCYSQWHLTCVRLTRRQAEALGSWLCPRCTCTTHVDNQAEMSQPTQSRAPPDRSPCDGSDLGNSLAHLKQVRQVVPRIPRGARIAAADALTLLIETAVEERSPEAMTKLFQFPRIALTTPRKEGGDSTSLTTEIKREIDTYMTSDEPVDILSIDKAHRGQTARQKTRASIDRLKRTISLKLADSDIRGAIRLLVSSDDIADSSDDVIENLKQKHPPAPADLRLPPAPDDTIQPYIATEADITSAIASFDTGSSAGLDGLRPAHLKDMTSRSAGEAGPRLTKALTSLVNFALRGEIPPSARVAFFGASLTALRKTDGGIRPIAVGSTYRRMATKVGLKPLSAQLGLELRPIQLGYGTPGGCEAAVHATRHFVAHLDTDSVAVKLDMRNAFNTVRRDHFLQVVRELATPLYHLLWQAYSQPTPLYYGTTQIISATGVQQGDPAGPAVFSLAIHPIAKAASCELNCWYLDDGTLGGGTTSVCENLGQLIPAMAEIGLEINSKKCEIILPGGVTEEVKKRTTETVRQVIPDAAILTESKLTILGAPISPGATEAVMTKKREELERMADRLQNLDAHSAFFLLKNCLWLPRLQYILRAAPIYKHPALLQPLDHVLKSAVSRLSNVQFDVNNWCQAVLPTRYGGLGLRRMEDIALPSYLASVYSCRQLVHAMVPARVSGIITQECVVAAEDWQTLACGSEAPEGDARNKQRAWDDILTEQRWKALVSEANQFARARLLSAATSESGAWLHAIPSTSLGTMIDKETLRISVALRVGADLCVPHLCRCGSHADSKGYHALTCQFSAGRHPRHTALNDVIRRSLQAAGAPSILEPAGLDRGDGKRPDGMTVFPYSHGKSMIWDATCVNTYAGSNVVLSATDCGGAAREEEARKRRKYAGLQQQFQFEPVAFETAGACGPSTKAFIKDLGSRLVDSSGDRRETAWLRQRLSIAIIRGNAASVLLTTASKGTYLDLQKAKPKQQQLRQEERTQEHPPMPQHRQKQQQQQQHTDQSLLPRQKQQPQKQSKTQQGQLQRPPQKPENPQQQELEQPEESGHLQQPLAPPYAPTAGTMLLASGQRPKGLFNLGSTCYMNAALQALFHSDQLCGEVLAARPSLSRPHPIAPQRVFAFLAFSERPTYRPAEFQRVALPPWLERGRQHDSSEFLRYLLDALHEEELILPCSTAHAAPSAVPLPVRPSATPFVRDNTSVPGTVVVDRLRLRRRHRSCDASPAPGGVERPPGGTAPDADRVQPVGADGHDDLIARTEDSDVTRTDPDRESGDVTAGVSVESSGDDVGAGDGDDGTTYGGAVDPPGQPSEPADPAVSLVRRLLTGRAETIYTCCACGALSRHVERVTDLLLTLPEALTPGTARQPGSEALDGSRHGVNAGRRS